MEEKKKTLLMPLIEVIKIDNDDFIITVSDEPWAPDEPIELGDIGKDHETY